MWREVCKFLAGALFAGSIANGYLWFMGASLPFMGYTISPAVYGLRAAVGVVFCVAFFYFGWLRKTSSVAR